MNLREHVTSIIEADGQGTADTVLPQCPGHTRAQVIAALANARTAGDLRTAGYVPVPDKPSAKLAVYVPAPELPDTPPLHRRRFPAVGSVWQLAEALR